MLQLELNTWEREDKVLKGVMFSEENAHNRDFFMKLRHVDLGRIFSNKAFLPYTFEDTNFF